MQAKKLNNFTTIESIYGQFIVNRHCKYQAETLIKSGIPHIQEEILQILSIINTLPKSCVVLDAGANIGLISIPIAKSIYDRGGRVHAFEAQRMMHYALCGGAALNDAENLYAYNMALGASVGKLAAPKPDYSLQQDFGMFSLSHPQASDNTEEIVMITTDSLKLPRLDFFKIDVEGMEIEVLRGAQETIRKYVPWCWVEYWKVDIKDIKKQFSGLGYKFFIMDKLNLLCAPADKFSNSQVKIAAQEV